MQTMLLIYNRHAGKDRNRLSLAEIVNTMTAQGYLVTMYPTQAPGDAGEAITRWGSSYDRIVAIGGDGTLNEAVSGLLRLPEKPPLGYIPAGSTNDFSKNLSLPALPAEAALVATGGVPRQCDVGTFNGRPFIYVAAFGAFADVSFNTPQRAKNLLGYAAYLLESVKRLPSIKPYQVTVEFDGQEISGSFLYGMVSNTTSVAGIQHFPLGDPKLDDGLLEVTLISPPKDIVELERLGRILLLGDPQPTASPLVQTFSASKVTIHAQEDLLWALDGENGGAHRTAEIGVIHHAFTIIHGA